MSTNLGDPLRGAKLKALRKRLAAMSDAELIGLVNAARANNAWPPDGWLERHAAKHGAGRNASQYQELGQQIKNTVGTVIYAFVHPFYLNAGLAFYDPRRGILVQYNLDEELNFDVIYLGESMDSYVAGKGELYWRLPTTERVR